MKWLFRIVMFFLLFMLVAVAAGGNIGPVELVVLPLLIIAVMWGCSRLVKLGADRNERQDPSATSRARTEP